VSRPTIRPQDCLAALAALADAIHLLPVGHELVVAKVWLQRALRDRLEGRAATIDEALGLPAPQPRQARAAERHALIREAAATAGLHGWAGAADLARMLAGDLPPPPPARDAVARLRAQRYAIGQRQIWRALADTSGRVCVSAAGPDSMQTSTRRRARQG